jgi:hypothetical protein
MLYAKHKIHKYIVTIIKELNDNYYITKEFGLVYKDYFIIQNQKG